MSSSAVDPTQGIFLKNPNLLAQNLEVAQNLTVDGNTTIAGTLTAIGGVLTVTNNVTLPGTLSVAGVTTHSSTSHFVGAVTADAAVSVGTTLTVTGAATLSSTVGVTGALTAANAVKMTDNGTVTQITSTSTGVTCSHNIGQITTYAQTLLAGANVSFTVTNTAVASAKSVVMACIGSYSGTGQPVVSVTGVSVGSFVVVIRNIDPSAALNAAAIINFAVINGA